MILELKCSFHNFQGSLRSEDMFVQECAKKGEIKIICIATKGDTAGLFGFGYAS